ncbi:cora-domain-containing protein [Xylariaceae sp. FL1019]|nr:cora-domain-containing protein [Xylariaceae sp. FL1019]
MATNPYSLLDNSRPHDSPAAPGPSSNPSASRSQTPKKKHRAGRKHKRSRRRSFAVPADELASRTGLVDSSNTPSADSFYAHRRNLSGTSLDSEGLLDHRDHQFTRARRPSVLATSYSMPQPGMGRLRSGTVRQVGRNNEETIQENTPLLSGSARLDQESPRGYGLREAHHSGERSRSRPRSTRSGASSHKRPGLLFPGGQSHNVNYPPSMPGTPPLEPVDRMGMSFVDVMLRDDEHSRHNSIHESNLDPLLPASSFERRHTIALQAEEDVCFPQDGMSEIADDDIQQARDKASMRIRRRRRGKWPDLSILEEWSRMEQEDRSEERRMKKITEPQLINGRLRPVHKGWFRTEEDAPYRFTYFNEELQSTIHSQTISELVQPDASFRELFIPDPPILSDSSSDEDEEPLITVTNAGRSSEQSSKGPTRQPSLATTQTAELQPELGVSPKQGPATSTSPSRNPSDTSTPKRAKSPNARIKSPPPPNGQDKKIRYGERPVWWLDVLSPTDAEMKVIAKAFGIHPLTSEDIMIQEQREKVELFRHYYFVSYRSFDQDEESENHLDPINMYVVVFREGVLSFHFDQTPHPANVRRRIRQLKDFMVLSSDWISYAIIDDITDVYQPLIQNIEDEVDDIDDKILLLHSDADAISPTSPSKQRRNSEQEKGTNQEGNTDSGRDMLRRVGDCRKKVMSLYRLLGNKADVIKGFAKRCNEHWEVAPRSEIGLYLGDIQDHIVTMTANLSHYEKILARCHANYIAQINIRMNERAEQTADVLGKLTVLGTIVLPMNIITGLWGMNVWVPGQEYEDDLTWFFCITGGLLIFGLLCFLIAKRVYGIV